MNPPNLSSQSNQVATLRIETAAKLACAFSGLVWGMMWVPLRTLEARGISGVWALLLFYIIPFALILPVIAWRWRQSFTSFRPTLLGLMSAFGLVAYSLALIETEVIKAMLLFYLTPLWSTLLARVFLGEPITPIRWLSLLCGLSGMWIVLASDSGLPWPENRGDWAALTSGLVWAVTANVLRADNGRTKTPELWAHNLFWSAIMIVIFIQVSGVSWSNMPSLQSYAGQLWWLVPSVILVLMLGIYATVWGAPKLNPGVVGLLFMTEISVGAVTAALWSGEAFGWREIVGILLITGAGVAESLLDLRRSRHDAAVR